MATQFLRDLAESHLEYDSPFTADVRTLPHYVERSETRALDVHKRPAINPDTGTRCWSIGSLF